MINLGVHGLNNVLAISFNSIVFHNEILIFGSMRLEIGTCQ